MTDMQTEKKAKNIPEEKLTGSDKDILLKIARDSISCAVLGEPLPSIDPKDHSTILSEIGASFVTLEKFGQLRGCIGAIEAYQPFVLDVQEHAAAAAVEDYRFSPVREDELPHVEIEISRLTPMELMEYSSSEDLISKLRVSIDGVLIKFAGRRATYLPQVWEKVPAPDQFMTQLCVKMGASPDLWRTQKIQVFTYQVESFKDA